MLPASGGRTSKVKAAADLRPLPSYKHKIVCALSQIPWKQWALNFVELVLGLQGQN